MTACPQPRFPASTPPRARAVPPEAEMEGLLHLLRELPPGCPEAKRGESRLAELVRPYLVGAAVTLAREWGVAAEDLVQVGLVRHLEVWRGFTPGLAPEGRCLYPAYLLRLARQAMVRAVAEGRSPVHVTDHARKAVLKAKRRAREAGVPVAEVLAAQGLEAATAHALGDGTVHAALPVEELLGLTDGAEGRERAVLQARAMVALHALPRLQRLAVSATVGVGQPGGRAASERTLAAEWRVPVAKVRQLRELGVRRLRKTLEKLEVAQ